MRDWYGITYPGSAFCPNWVLKLWKKYMCSHGWHLFDECDNIEKHSIYCDACDLDIEIKFVRKWNYETKTNDLLGK